jgi:cyclopropane-fatty-acyl-phospholipid synthase
LTAVLTRERGASAEAIDRHYSVGNEFYRLWLDPSMTYSSALWEEGDTLERAQRRKLDYHCDQAGVRPGMRVLDVGCGWGSGLRHLVEERGVERAVGLTLSSAQAEWLREALPEGAEPRCEGWADHSVADPYDAIISIGAFEHFAKATLGRDEKIAAYRAYFRKCHALLRDGGRMTVQTIAYGNISPAQRSSFVEHEIFPESELPFLAEVAEASQGLFEIVAVRNDREHYARTARAWLAALRAQRDAALALVGDEIYTRYERYLGLFVIGFHAGTMDLLRFTFRRNARPAS